MAKIKTNKSEVKKLDTGSPVLPKAQPPSYEVRPIKDGFLITKSWRDKNGDYQSEESFSEDNPLEGGKMSKKEDEEDDD